MLAVESTGPDSSSDIIRVLDTSGPFMSMSYLASKNQVLLSSRPAAHFANIRHRVFTLDHSPDGTPVLSLIQTIQGKSLSPKIVNYQNTNNSFFFFYIKYKITHFLQVVPWPPVWLARTSGPSRFRVTASCTRMTRPPSACVAGVSPTQWRKCRSRVTSPC